MHKISIITVNFNNKKGLAKTIDSVLTQTYSNIEYIIIDGGSTDGSKELIEQYTSSITYWISEKDKGIYDAMNKGITHATGDYLLFLNSGDFFISVNVLNDIFGKKIYKELLIIGRQYYINQKGKITSSRHLIPEDICEDFFWSNTLPHQATFINKNLLDQIGGFDLKYKVVADWAFWYEAIITNNSTYLFIEHFISYMESDGIPSDINKCRKEMAYFLITHKTNMTENDWIKIIEHAEKSYLYKRASKRKISKLLVKIALYLNK